MVPGNTQYDLMPASVIWTVTRTEGGCIISGQVVVNIPSFENQDLNLLLLRPAYGYLNVVGLEGGDFHSVIVSAFNPDARLKKTCSGDPPTVTEDLFEAGYILHILWRKNMYEECGLLVLSGMQVFDAGKPDAFLNFLPSGPARDMVSQALSQAQSSTSGTSRLYTWE